MAKKLLVVVLLLSPSPGTTQTLSGKVVGITDGDTLTLLVGQIQHKIRLSGIDTPERGQPYGNAARQRLSDLVYRKEVRVETDKINRYGRVIGKIWAQSPDCPTCGKTLDVNLALLTVGLAWWYRYYKDEQSLEDQGRYEFAEHEAKNKQAGLWHDPNPIPPWEWRRGKRSVTSFSESFTCGSKTYCREMTSCEEARFYLSCGLTRLDGDGDGVPCEAMCR